MEWVWQGCIRHGTKVKAGTIQDVLGAHSKTFELASLANPTTCKPGTNQLDTCLQWQLEALQ